MRAELIKDGLEDFNGHASLYRLSPPLDGHEYVVVSAVNVMFSGPETSIFAASEDGKVTSYSELEGSLRGDRNHAEALRGAGYEITTHNPTASNV